MGEGVTVVDSQQAHITRLARHVADVLIPENRGGGFTFNPLTFQSLPPFDHRVFPEIYLVSIKGHERIFSTIPSFEECRKWILDSYEWLCVYGNFIGFWEHEGHFYLDITHAIYGYERTVAFANSNNQIYCFNPYTEEPIAIKPVQISA